MAAAIALLTWTIFARSIAFAFINFDDHTYILDNPHVTTGLSAANLRWALTTFYFANWHPLTWLAYQSVYTAFGPSPAAYHALNVLLHGLSAALLFLFLVRATGAAWAAVAAAALFAWHPLRVESVAWISETKDCLCCFFWLLTMLAYQHYAHQPRVWRYLLVMAATALALASKATAVALPCTLLLLDYWPLGRAMSWRRWPALVAEKLPLLAMAAGAGAANFLAQRAMHAELLDALVPPHARVANAIVSVAVYLRQTVWPAGQCAFYPHPSLVGLPIPTSAIVASAAIVLLITVGCALLVRRCPPLIVGWLWFLGTLAPAIGLVQVGAQSHADRYTYVPSIGLSIATVWGLTALLKPRRRNARWLAPAVGAAAAAIALAMIVATQYQLSTWRDTVALFTRANAVTPRNYLARSELSEQLRLDGDTAGALTLAQQAVQICPMLPGPHRAMAAALEQSGQDRPAVRQWEAAIRDGGDDAPTRDRLGSALVRLNRMADAEQQFRVALRFDPHDAVALNNRGVIAASQGQMDAAIADWQAAIVAAPGFGPAHGWLGSALQQRGDRRGAVVQFRAAAAAGEKRPQWLTALAWLEATAAPEDGGAISPQQMVDDARRACDATGRSDPLALDALAAALARAGQFDAAANTAAKAAALAEAAGQRNLAKEIESRMMGYRAGRPYIAPRVSRRGLGASR